MLQTPEDIDMMMDSRNNLIDRQLTQSGISFRCNKSPEKSNESLIKPLDDIMERSWSENMRFGSGDCERQKSGMILEAPIDIIFDTNGSGSINSDRDSMNSMRYVHFTQEYTRQTSVDAHDLALSLV